MDRTQVDKAVQDPRTGLWSISFEMFAGRAGKEYLMGAVISPNIFKTEDEAYAAGGRALTILEQTGQFPNMCEAF